MSYSALEKHYRDKNHSRLSVDVENSETGVFLSANNGLARDADDHAGYPPLSTDIEVNAGKMRSRRRMPIGSKRLALILLGLVGLVMLFGRKDSREAVVGYVNDTAGHLEDAYQNHAPWKAKPEEVITGDADLDDASGGTALTAPADPSTPAPAPVTGTSSDTVREKPKLHADPTKTTRCDSTTARDRNGNPRPLVQYALMIDAGSTGSRIHVYRFNYCAEAPELEDEYFEMLQGGLSNYGTNPAGAADSLRPLLKSALARVPKSLQKCAPVAVKATAGLRLLPGQQANDVIKAVRTMLEKEYPFPIADGKNVDGTKASKGVEIMEGKDEGVFAWITVNYLLNRIGSSAGKTLETAAVMDLGGGSTQIVFEPKFASAVQGMQPGEHVYKLDAFGAQPYTLYQNSYLGYGLMQARMSINSIAAFTYSLAHPGAVLTGSAHKNTTGSKWGASNATDAGKPQIPSPCFANGRTKDVLISQPGQNTQANVTMVGTTGGFTACRRLVEVMMNKDAVCKSAPCSFAGVYQPSLMETFKTAPIIALSYFYDRLTPLGLGPQFKISDLEALAQRACAYSKKDTQKFDAKAIAELEDRPETCLDLSFMHGLLSLGYELSGEREVSVAKKLGGTELGWCLGAQLSVLDDGLLCKP
ncbi:Nucleoside phosphatase GDA1/CD39 [Kalmanozyma brasiliensis GHG001]|uniref:guanosine-diphosphatase n=1 Tax=Kalmanozyma brasiliensis (strain GHG001) TaxID=1365824 RepID=V5EW19_KALBG|nr:Nucleoside phosphatase GDA1/CD39 [Kalmanozyma brasiliensis GHG001]EST06484.1 Nucleoside phosphatase GDA1/CD39 [Kalmanozyma brasiliensis GHG001]